MSKTKNKIAPADYLKLVTRFPIRPLGSEKDHAAALAAIEPLVGRRDLTAGEGMYLDALSRFIEDYEEERHPVDTSSLTPVEFLRELMEQREMNVNDLGRVLGSQPLASMILRGRRGISKTSIMKLAAHFRVDPGLLMDRPRSANRPRRRPTRVA